MDELDGLDIDDSCQLYWHGKPIEIRKRVQLTMSQRMAALAGILAAVVVEQPA